ncbi:MAG TPA: sugar phosphate isomerase/epimerase family protein [Planctomycetota bacterium]|nr:sugar phosphate isomerase/epimerase family protein [Planctomycetota bacterium]
MTLKTCITNYSFNRSLRGGRMDVEGFVDWCGEAGLEGVDLMVYYWKDKDAEMAKLPGWLERSGVTLVGYGVGTDFMTRDAAQIAKMTDVVRGGIEDASRIGSKMVRVFGGHSLEGFSFDEGVKHLAACFRDLVKLAEDKDVTLTVENHGGFPATADEVIAVIRAIGSPNFASLLDTGNFLGAGADPLVETKKLVPYVRHVHVKDMLKFPAGSDQGHKPQRADYNIRATTVGAGVVPNGEIFKVLAAGGYDGYVSLEAEGPETDDEAERASAGLAHIRKCIAAL